MTVSLKNRSGIPDRLLHRLVRVALPPGTPSVAIAVSDRLRRRNFVAESWPDAVPPAQVEVSINVLRPYPFYQKHTAKARARGYLDLGWLLGPEELALALLAHELRHVWQSRHGSYCDTDADRWALGRLSHWRRHENR